MPRDMTWAVPQGARVVSRTTSVEPPRRTTDVTGAPIVDVSSDPFPTNGLLGFRLDGQVQVSASTTEDPWASPVGELTLPFEFRQQKCEITLGHAGSHPLVLSVRSRRRTNTVRVLRLAFSPARSRGEPPTLIFQRMWISRLHFTHGFLVSATSDMLKLREVNGVPK